MNTRIKLIRDTLKLSQEEFGEAIGIKRSGVSNIESGQRSVSERHIKLLKSAYNVNEHWLRTGEGEMFNPANESLDALAEANHIDPITRAIVVGLLEMPAAHREPFINLIFRVSSMVTTGDYERAKVEALAAETVFGTGLDSLATVKDHAQDDEEEQPHTV